jgi:hypothetical protein
MLASIIGCGEDSAPSMVDVAPIPTDVITPQAVIASYERALTELNLDAVIALLDPPTTDPSEEARFRYRDDFDPPWIHGPHWSYEVEVSILANMMDSDFDGDVPPVTSIEADFDVLRETGGCDRPTLFADALIRVLVGPDTGWTSVTSFQFRMVRDAGGFLRIRDVWEWWRPSGTAETWTRINQRYRD